MHPKKITTMFSVLNLDTIDGLIRVKPRTSHERAIMKENWGEQGEKEDEEVICNLANQTNSNQLILNKTGG